MWHLGLVGFVGFLASVALTALLALLASSFCGLLWLSSLVWLLDFFGFWLLSLAFLDFATKQKKTANSSR